MKTSQEGIDLIKQFEKLALIAYLCSAKKWTIGYGHVILGNEQYFMSRKITQEEAEDLLKKDLSIAEDCINNFVKTALTQAQFDSQVSIIFNIGVNAYKESTLLKVLNNEI